MKNEEMTGKELFNWAVKNKVNSWLFPMLMKLNENKIKSLSEEQLDAIKWFIETMCYQKFFQGNDPVIRVSSFVETLESIKEIRKETQ